MSTDLDTDPTEALVRATFAAAADSLAIDEPPVLSADDGAVVPLAGRRRHPMRWGVAAAVVALLAGGATWMASRPDVPVVVQDQSPPSDGSFEPFLEPTWVPDGMVLMSAVQYDRPPQYMADVVAPDGGHATVHWTNSSRWDLPTMRDPGFDTAPARIDGTPLQPDLRVWAARTGPAPRYNGTTPPDVHPEPTPAFLQALAAAVGTGCSDADCSTLSLPGTDPAFVGARIVRQGPDDRNGSQTTLYFRTIDGTGFVNVRTWNTSWTTPESGDVVMPAPGIATPLPDDPDFVLERLTVSGGHRALRSHDSQTDTLIVGFDDDSMTAAITSQPNWAPDSEAGDPPTFAGLDRATTIRIAASLRPRIGADFITLADRLQDQAIGPTLASITGDGWTAAVGDYTGPFDVESDCLLLMTFRPTRQAGAQFGGEPCLRRAGSTEPVVTAGPIVLADGRRAWGGLFHDEVAAVRLTFADGTVIERPTVAIPGREVRALVADVPLLGGTAELLAVDGSTLATAATTTFGAEAYEPMWIAALAP